ncbi:MAG: putative transporter, substrate-binding protein [Bacteroidota bacterium]|nr:putative transporter, substrate-binding protein [Bacteroidota bacterium]
MKYLLVLLIPIGMFLSGCNSCSKPKDTTINLRLQWIPQTQFAGYIVAKQKGFYEAEGLKVNLNPAGPDLKPQVTVANGSDQIGIGVPNQVISARTNGVPLVTIAQIFQDSPNRYVLKSQNKIDSLKQLKGKKIGLWLGGDEAEFVSMLKTANMTLNDVTVVAQEYSVAPFLQDQYVLSMVTVYNELNLIQKEGYQGDRLQILSPKDYHSAILGDMIFTTDKYIKDNPGTVQKFLTASIKGWKYCIDHPEEALDIVMKYNPELNRDEQKYMLTACIGLIKTGSSLTNGIGYINEDDYSNAQRILKISKQIDKEVDIKTTFNLSIWNEVPDSVKVLK